MSSEGTVGLLGRDKIVERLLTETEEKRIVISPLLRSKQLQPASLDVRLGPEFHAIKIGKMTHLDPRNSPQEVQREVKKYTDSYKILAKREPFVLHPGEFVLGATLEHVTLPRDIAARFEGRSSWGRLGILVHATAGYIDPGFRGNVTVELANVGKIPVPLFPGVRIGQLSFFVVTGAGPYGGKYQDSFGVVPSRYFEDREYNRLRVSEAEYFGMITDYLRSGARLDEKGELSPVLLAAIRRVIEEQETDDEPE